MSEKASSPGGAGTANGNSAGDPADSRPGGPLPGDGESIVVPPSILKQQAGWAQPGDAPRPTGATKTDETPQIFASTVRRQDTSEAGYDENPGNVGKLGVILGTVLSVLLIGSAVTLYLVNKDDDSSDSAAAKPDAAKSAPATPTADPVPPIKDTAKVLPTVTGDFGKKATIEVPADQSDGNFVVKVLTEGTGPKVEKNSWTSVDYTGKDWNTGKDIPSSYDEKGKPQIFQAGTDALIPALDQAVVGKKAGSRLLVVAPPAAAFGAQGNPSMSIGAKDNLIFVIDIRNSNAPDAVVSGTVTPPPADFPQVKDNGKKPADITPVAGAADPTELKSHVLIKGEGRKVEKGEKILVQYTGALFKDGKVFDSSLSKGQAFSFPLGGGQVIAGWDQGLEGQTIGSRVELVIPASLGYKDQAQGDIPANSTLVFVVDILDAGQG
ncbi:FKBP-type peptidyl-prolyl cis-trans isomerase [Streptomyces sp. BE20]|uniref:FKBP-type peptidyl-prolyl cis-trans isomerase n=1 Tax=Streptomycetaceae TaxID=2062 RepID=UPI002E78E05C|nr:MULTISPECIES: FKBP-type peptidyl-prolyl cis-trans isomerase [unclassified Streptomyces]MED7950750.1 FKBP-type peptidyl-prolyl cis-trans isomerase [Streptomyces sp. BE303]MEE1821005.1 FKBP-type peptidyl-prolyl cis-trans isomerase [Streptomyces sp. BE20]